MATHKYIYWQRETKRNEKGERFANVHILVGYNEGKISDFIEMARLLRENFPQATWNKIYAGKIFKDYTGFLASHSIISWNAYIPEGEYSEWTQIDNNKPFPYHW